MRASGRREGSDVSRCARSCFTRPASANRAAWTARRAVHLSGQVESSDRMSVDMNSQASDSNEEDFGVNSEDEEDDDDDDGGEDDDQGDISTYYEGVASDVEQQGADSFDPEEYSFTCLTYKESQRVLIEEVNTVAAALKVSVRVCSGFLVLRTKPDVLIVAFAEAGSEMRTRC